LARAAETELSVAVCETPPSADDTQEATASANTMAITTTVMRRTLVDLGSGPLVYSKELVLPGLVGLAGAALT
jgi:hypothetical protein